MTNANRELLKNGIEEFGLKADDKTLIPVIFAKCDQGLGAYY